MKNKPLNDLWRDACCDCAEIHGWTNYPEIGENNKRVARGAA
jgi:hypothetical protein